MGVGVACRSVPSSRRVVSRSGGVSTHFGGHRMENSGSLAHSCKKQKVVVSMVEKVPGRSPPAPDRAPRRAAYSTEGGAHATLATLREEVPAPPADECRRPGDWTARRSARAMSQLSSHRSHASVPSSGCARTSSSAMRLLTTSQVAVRRVQLRPSAQIHVHVLPCGTQTA